MRLSFTVPKVSFNKARFGASAQRIIAGALRHALRDWFNTLWEDLPVYTGMVKGSLIPLGAVLGNVTLGVSPVKASHGGKSLQAGIALGETAFDLSGIAKGDITDFHYNIEYNIVVPHWRINEEFVGLGNPPLHKETPWRSLAKANEVFRQSLADENLPVKLARCYREAIRIQLEKM